MCCNPLKIPTFKALTFSIFFQCLGLGLTGCTVGPDYRSVPLEGPLKWSNSNTAASLKAADAELPALWWSVLNDSSLNDFMDLALQNNPTIAQAIARVEQARADQQRYSGAFLPALSATTNLSRSRSTTDTNAAALPLPGSITNSEPTLQTNTTANLGISWEIDLFGRIRRSVEAAQARLDAQSVEAYSVKLSLQAQLVESWFLLRACELEYTQLGRDTQSRESAYKLTRLRTHAGFSAQADYALAHANWIEAQTQQESQNTACKQLRHTLIALIIIKLKPG